VDAGFLVIGRHGEDWCTVPIMYDSGVVVVL
jgi:hypothetical protein